LKSPEIKFRRGKGEEDNVASWIQRFEIVKHTIFVGWRFYHLPSISQSAVKPAPKFARECVPFLIQERQPSA
jgi:hypothetical protein